MNIIIVYGGKSVEHDISIITALQCYDALLNLKHNVKLVYLSQENQFFVGKNLQKKENYIDKSKLIKHLQKCEIAGQFLRIGKRNKLKIDVAVNCCHGGIGENGILAGFFEMSNIKFTSANMLSSAICMNKSHAKTILKNDIPVVDGLLISKSDYENSRDAVLKKIRQKFPQFCFVKPNNLGSSIGIAKCSAETVAQQLDAIFMMDNEALVEKVVENLVEINCAVFKLHNDICLSELEQPINKSEFLSFDDKYLSNRKSKGMKSLDRIIPAPISDKMREKVLKYSKIAYQKLGLKGVVRIDFLIDEISQKIFLNEINTIPGSLAFYLFEPKGIDYISLLEMLIDEAQNQAENQITYFESNVLK